LKKANVAAPTEVKSAPVWGDMDEALLELDLDAVSLKKTF